MKKTKSWSKISRYFLIIVTCLIVSGVTKDTIAATFIVNTTDSTLDQICDTTHCSLWDSVWNSNIEPGHDTILFDLPGSGPHIISSISAQLSGPLTNLPSSYGFILYDPVTIDGLTTSNGSQRPSPIVSIQGPITTANPPSIMTTGFTIWPAASGSEIRGLSVGKYSRGIAVENGEFWNINESLGIVADIQIQKNYVGINIDGITPLFIEHGIILSTRSNQNNSHDISSILIQQNVIDAYVSGIYAGGDSLGGKIRSVIIRDNIIGLIYDQSTLIASGKHSQCSGITADYMIDSLDILQNSVSGFSTAIFIGNINSNQQYFNSVRDVLLEKNFLGLNQQGTIFSGQDRGIAIALNNNSFGGTAHFIENHIAGSDRIGIDIVYILNNGGSLGQNAVTVPTVLSAFAPQNFPLITRADTDGTNILIEGELISHPGKVYKIEAYANNNLSPLGHGDGEIYIGSANVTTDLAGRADFVITANGSFPAGQYISTTATNMSPASTGVSMTSEFSENFVSQGCIPTDNDQDGYFAFTSCLGGNDCDDNNANIFPGAMESCDLEDNNCNGQVDEGLPVITFLSDLDGDGYGNPFFEHTSCELPGGGSPLNNNFVPESNGHDCLDNDPMIHPAATEICGNSLDEDCSGDYNDGLPTLTYYGDGDGDGYGASYSSVELCEFEWPGMVLNDDDCLDGNANVHPGATEIRDYLDNDCDGQIDEGTFVDPPNRLGNRTEREESLTNRDPHPILDRFKIFQRRP